MKRILYSILSIVMLLSITSSATAQIKYSIESGYAQTNIGSNRAANIPYHQIGLGGNIHYGLKYNFGISTGLRYDYIFGKKTQYYPKSSEATYNYTGHLLNIPILVDFKQPIMWGLNLYAFTGAKINLGLNQQVIQKSTTIYVKNGTFDTYETEQNRLYLQWRTGGGLELKSFRLKGGYDFGVHNISRVAHQARYPNGWWVAFEYTF